MAVSRAASARLTGVRLLARTLAAGFVAWMVLWLSLSVAVAQGPAPTPLPIPDFAGSSAVASSHAILDAGTRFLRRLGNEAAWLSTGAPSTSNPFGGGADMQSGAERPATPAGPRYRIWSEGYGVGSRMDPDATFAGDKRTIWGGIAGIGAILAPGLSAGLSVDQSRTKVDLLAAAQGATIDLTQIGGNLAFESGPWSFGMAAIYGVSDTDLRRGASGNPALASYDTRLWGALAELSYLHSRGNWRVVPKLGADWAMSDAAAFSESGGVNPFNGSAIRSSRARITGGAEIGHSWFADRMVFDLSGYARAVEIVQLDRGEITLTAQNGSFAPRTIPGVSESRFGIDTGAAMSWRVSQALRFYAIYDARWRANYESHAGTLGLELRW